MGSLRNPTGINPLATRARLGNCYRVLGKVQKLGVALSFMTCAELLGLASVAYI